MTNLCFHIQKKEKKFAPKRTRIRIHHKMKQKRKEKRNKCIAKTQRLNNQRYSSSVMSRIVTKNTKTLMKGKEKVEKKVDIT